VKSRETYLADFHEGDVFHVYNRTNNKELLFTSPSDKDLFLKRFSVYLRPFLKTYCHNLLSNHFHFLVRVRSREEICAHLQKIKPQDRKKIEQLYLDGEETAEHLLEMEWVRFLTSYAMRFNLRHVRKGNLFYRPFKRIAVLDDEYFRNAVLYIHTNAYKHNVNCADKFEWCSYKQLLESEGRNPVHKEIFKCFNGKENFILKHKETIESFFPSGAILDPQNHESTHCESVFKNGAFVKDVSIENRQ
jgi:putative transposase